MDTKIIKIDSAADDGRSSASPDAGRGGAGMPDAGRGIRALADGRLIAALAEAGEVIRSGGLVAFPTETVYGLGGNALDPQASKRIYAAKGRPSDNPLIVHIADISELEPLAAEIPESARLLAEKWWPGPMTLIFKKKAAVPDETTGGLDTVAVRMPSHPVAAALIRAAGVPVAAPSANRSGRPSPTCAAHVIEDLDGRVDMIIDGGDCGIGLESTIIDVTGSEPVLLRPGRVTIEEIRAVAGCGKIDPAVLAPPSAGLRPRAPGMKYRHYAPRAPLTLIEGEREAVAAEISRRCALAEAAGRKAGVICSSQLAAMTGCPLTAVLGDAEDPEELARGLFAALRSMDSEGADEIYAETFPETGFGLALRNRLLKAAGYNVVKV